MTVVTEVVLTGVDLTEVATEGDVVAVTALLEEIDPVVIDPVEIDPGGIDPVVTVLGATVATTGLDTINPVLINLNGMMI